MVQLNTVFYTRYQVRLYLWQIRIVIKHGKRPKYCDQGCLKNFHLHFMFSAMVQFSEQSSIFFFNTEKYIKLLPRKFKSEGKRIESLEYIFCFNRKWTLFICKKFLNQNQLSCQENNSPIKVHLQKLSNLKSFRNALHLHWTLEIGSIVKKSQDIEV